MREDARNSWAGGSGWPCHAPVGALLLFLVGGCHIHPRPPRHPADDPEYVATLGLRPKGMQDVAPEALRVLPGDTVRVRTAAEHDKLYEGLLVDELGNIHLPLAGDVPVGGQTLGEAEKLVEKALVRYSKVMRASVEISQPGGHRATVVGAVENPGIQMVLPGMRLAELIAAAGGGRIGDAPDVADLQAARLVRDGKVLPVSIPFALAGNPRHNVRIRAGDHLYVPAMRGKSITVLGEVASPQLIPYYNRIRLSQVLAQAGGLPMDARMRDVRIIRGPMDAPKIYKVSLNSLARGNDVDAELAPGDIVFVGRRSIAELREVLNAFSLVLSTGISVGIAYGVTQATN